MRMPQVTYLVAIVLALSATGSYAQDTFDQPTLEFARQVNATALAELPVQMDGRLGVLDTLARQQLLAITGKQTLGQLPPAVAYMELYLCTGRYLDQPVLYAKERGIRRALADCLELQQRLQLDRQRRLPPALLLNEHSCSHLIATGRAGMDDLRRAASLPSLESAMWELGQRPQLRGPIEGLAMRLNNLVSAPSPLIVGGCAESGSAAHPGPAEGSACAALDAAGKQFALAWRQRDAKAVNQSLEQIMQLQHAAAAADGLSVPVPWMRKAELAYNRTRNATAAWAGFALSTLLLIFAAASGASWARRAGLLALATSTAVLMAGFCVRWALSGRQWYLPPIMNQFEAVIGSALLAAIIGLAIELYMRRNYIGLAAAFYATVALLAGFFLPQQMGAAIKAQPGILSSPIMAVHVAVIIVGHALVGMTMVISIAYLLSRAFGSSGKSLKDSQPPSQDAAQSIDRCNLIVVQLAAWTVILGTFLGSYWADFAWGRWWGWDVKEVWAAMTALSFIAILHIRPVLPERHRGWITAVLCIIGAAIMLFNWIGVNYYLTGLHSYA